VAKAKLKSKLNPAQDIHCNFVKCKVCKQCSLPILQRVAPNAKKVLSLFLVAIHKDEIDRKREGKSFKKNFGVPIFNLKIILVFLEMTRTIFLKFQT
jgi:hypothetical protein